MPIMKLFTCVAVLNLALATAKPIVVDSNTNVTYQGLTRNGIEVFLNIPYGQDTSGKNRFKPAVPYEPAPGTKVNATAYGHACPQPLGQPGLFPLVLSNITDISENCLNLNVARPGGTCNASKLPVMVFIHGGSFWSGSNAEMTTAPDGLILESVANRLAVMHVAMNYRLGAFGFAQSKALRQEGSENAGLRDQRLAVEWVRDHIASFGGDPERITIFGQSSGGLAIGMQTMAYGGTKPAPFQQGIFESQALEPGITGNFTYHQMDLLASALNCTSSALDSNETVSCLRNADFETFLNASIDTYSGDITNNIGDCWLPVVDGDFLPAAPSTLVAEHRMANITTMGGWADDDVGFFTDRTIQTENDTYSFVAEYLPDMNDSSLQALLALYPVSDFQANPSANLSAQFYRSARIFRDILMTCMPTWYAENLHQMGNGVYLYDQNATILDPALASLGYPGLGPVHTSEFAYVFANFSAYNHSGFPIAPTQADYVLQRQESRSWSTFAATGQPFLANRDTLKGWDLAFANAQTSNETDVYVIGGASPGLSSFGGPRALPQLAKQKLKSRCDFLNSPDIIAQLRF